MIERDSQRIQVIENYKDFTPPAWVSKAVSRLLDGIPPQYLSGLRTITLSNTGGFNHRLKRQKAWSRKRKVPIRECRGFYSRKWKGKPAQIELFVDKIIVGWPALFLKIPYFQEYAISDTLYHELGHHIHRTSAPEYKEREDVAEDWRKRLVRLYFPRRYWYLKPLWKLVRLMVWLSRLIRGRTGNC
jgi:hypothetical protein